MYVCGECKEEFGTFQAKANHVRWQHRDNSKLGEKLSKEALKTNEKRFGKYIEEDIKCEAELCNNIIHIKYRKGGIKRRFCCKSCANTKIIHTEEGKIRSSNAIKEAWKNGIYYTETYQQKQSTNIKFSSSKEREIVKYFKAHYPQYNWKSGGNLRYKETGIGRDLYSDILKICFEYDGIWHFKDIHHQLETKRFKDKLLEEWCIENGYRLIRIDEREFIDFNQIEKLFFEDTSPIIKIGKRYWECSKELIIE
jgi:hypothetical protein